MTQILSTFGALDARTIFFFKKIVYESSLKVSKGFLSLTLSGPNTLK